MAARIVSCRCGRRLLATIGAGSRRRSARLTLQVFAAGRPAEKVMRCPDCQQDFSGLDVEEFTRQCAKSFD